MTVLPLDDESGNAAKYMGLEVTVGTEIRVNSYYLDRYPFKQWADTGDKFPPAEGAIDYGEKSGDNFKFTKAGKYDVYANYEGGFKFYVAEHVDSYTIEMTAVLFNGATKDTTVTLNSQDAYSNANFEPVIHAREGYATRGVFTDEACTTAYTPTKFTAAGHLYVKYTKVGFYVISGATGYSIDGGVLMMTEGIAAGNKAEASITVTAVNETYSFVYYDGEMSGHDGLGADKDYSKMAVNEDSHIKFLKTGTYAVYWSNGDNKIYLNAGNTAFYTTFLSATGGECKTDNTTDVEALQVIWGQQKIAFNALEDAEKAELEAVGFDKGKEDGTLAEQVVARYHYIVTKYGTDAFEDFIWHNEINVSASFINYNSPVAANNAVMIAIVSVIALVSVASIVTVIVIKKKSLH